MAVYVLLEALMLALAAGALTMGHDGAAAVFVLVAIYLRLDR